MLLPVGVSLAFRKIEVMIWQKLNQVVEENRIRKLFLFVDIRERMELKYVPIGVQRLIDRGGNIWEKL